MFRIPMFTPGCYIRAFQHYDKEGYSSICSDTNGCPVMLSDFGPLVENEASSVYCYCGVPRKFGLILIYNSLVWISDSETHF